MAAGSIEEAVHTRALADATITGYIGQRLFFVQAEEEAAYPYTVYRVVSDPHDPMAFGETASGQARVQFSTWSEDRYEALNVAYAILDRFNLFGGTMDSMTVYSVRCTGPVVIKEPGRDSYQSIVDAVVMYEEA